MKGQVSLEFLLVFAILISAMAIILPAFNQTTNQAKFLMCVRSAEYALDDIQLGVEKLSILGDGNPYFVRLDPGQCEFNLSANANLADMTVTYKDFSKSIHRTLDSSVIPFTTHINKEKKLSLASVSGNIQFNTV